MHVYNLQFTSPACSQCLIAHTLQILQIIIPLDELPPHHIDREELAASVERSHRWEVRSLREHLKDSRDRQQAIFCVVHGGTDVELRTRSLEYLTALPWDGYAIGGSLGAFCCHELTQTIRYLYTTSHQPSVGLGNGRGELKTLLNWMMPLFNTEDRHDKVRSDRKDHKYVILKALISSHLSSTVSTSPRNCRY
jgi:tRNA-guanine family transglycosylase